MIRKQWNMVEKNINLDPHPDQIILLTNIISKWIEDFSVKTSHKSTRRRCGEFLYILREERTS